MKPLYTASRAGVAMLVAGALAVAVAACGSSGASTSAATGGSSSGSTASAATAVASTSHTSYSSYLSSLYAAAKKAGDTSLVVYSAYGGGSPNTLLNAVMNDFQKAYPTIKVTLTDSAGTQLFSRIDGEYAAGKRQVDAVLSGPSDVGHFIDQKRLVAWKPKDASLLQPSLVESHGYYTVPFRHLFGLVYNTHALSASQVPTNVAQLAEPKWKGKVAIGQPDGTQPSDFAITTLLYDKLITPQQLKEIGANATIRGDNTAIADTIAGRAEIGIWGPSEQATVAGQSGAPVAFQKFTASDFDAPGYGIFTNAPHEAAAKLLEAWLISAAGQKSFQNDTPFYGVWKKNPEVPLHGPGDAGNEVIPQIPADRFEAEIKKYRAVVIAAFGKGQSS